MALSAGTPVSIVTATNGILDKVNTDVCALTYQDTNTDSDIFGIVLDISGGSISAGSANLLYDAPGVSADLEDAAIEGTDKYVLVYWRDDEPQHQAVRVTRSGNTLTEGTPDWPGSELGNWCSVKIGLFLNSTAALIPNSYCSARFYYNRLDLSTFTVEAREEQNETRLSAPFNTIVYGCIGLDTDDMLVCYTPPNTTDLMFQMVNISTGISQGIEDDSTLNIDTTFSPVDALVRLSDTKALCGINISNQINLFTVNRSGSAISSYGSTSAIGTEASFAMDRINAEDRILLARISATDTITVEAFSVSGDTITDDAIDTTISAQVSNTISSIVGVTVLDTNEAIVAWLEDDGNIYASRITDLSDLNYDLTHSANGIPGSIRVIS
jgi:hypothetical protein